MSNKTLDIEKVREAIKVLEETRELLDKIEEVLPKEKAPGPLIAPPWQPYVYPYNRELYWQTWTDNVTWNDTRGSGTCINSANPATYTN